VQTYWQPHNRPVGRRIQNMGWTPDNKVSARQGGLTAGLSRLDQASKGCKTPHAQAESPRRWSQLAEEQQAR